MIIEARAVETLVPGEKVTVGSIYHVFRNFPEWLDSNEVTVQSVVHTNLSSRANSSELVQVTFAETHHLEDKNLSIIFERGDEVGVAKEGITLSTEHLKELTKTLDRPTKGPVITTVKKVWEWAV